MRYTQRRPGCRAGVGVGGLRCVGVGATVAKAPWAWVSFSRRRIT